jgi:tRNA-2-methylthio-N6-dimethylallyladenosine synthase
VHPAALGDPVRTYLVKTLGCQMNVHDSEHMAGLLEEAGYVAASPVQAAAEDADVIVINTCAVRENAADKLYGNLGRLAATRTTSTCCRSCSSAHGTTRRRRWRSRSR